MISSNLMVYHTYMIHYNHLQFLVVKRSATNKSKNHKKLLVMSMTLCLSTQPFKQCNQSRASLDSKLRVVVSFSKFQWLKPVFLIIKFLTKLSSQKESAWAWILMRRLVFTQDNTKYIGQQLRTFLKSQLWNHRQKSAIVQWITYLRLQITRKRNSTQVDLDMLP